MHRRRPLGFLLFLGFQGRTKICPATAISPCLVPELFARVRDRQARTSMLTTVIKALSQMLSPPFRMVLLKSVALALALLTLLGVGLHRLLVMLAAAAERWGEAALGGKAHTLVIFLDWTLSIAAALVIVAGAIFLMPAVTALVASFFADEIALEVERVHYPVEPVGTALPLTRALWEGTKTALLALAVYMLAMPFLLFAGIGVAIFFLATAFLLSREYFELVAMRHRPPEAAKTMRRDNQGMVFLAGLFIAAFVSVPILNLATPLFSTALMVHLHKRLSADLRRKP
jgi:uncharacterized protein involved in cysteine biosynthesis